jgi:hypothetical protein
MYFLEILIKKILSLKERKKIKFQDNFTKVPDEYQEECEKHIYMAIDSSKNYLACKNCGHLIKREDLN